MPDPTKPMTAADEARAYLSVEPAPKWFNRDHVAQLLAEHDEQRDRANEAEAEVARLREADEQNVGSDRLPMTKRELKALGYELAKPINFDRSQLSWDRAAVKKLYWALQHARGVAMIAERDRDQAREELARVERMTAAELLAWRAER